MAARVEFKHGEIHCVDCGRRIWLVQCGTAVEAWDWVRWGNPNSGRYSAFLEKHVCEPEPDPGPG